MPVDLSSFNLDDLYRMNPFSQTVGRNAAAGALNGTPQIQSNQQPLQNSWDENGNFVLGYQGGPTSFRPSSSNPFVGGGSSGTPNQSQGGVPNPAPATGNPFLPPSNPTMPRSTSFGNTTGIRTGSMAAMGPTPGMRNDFREEEGAFIPSAQRAFDRPEGMVDSNPSFNPFNGMPGIGGVNPAFQGALDYYNANKLPDGTLPKRNPFSPPKQVPYMGTQPIKNPFL